MRPCLCVASRAREYRVWRPRHSQSSAIERSVEAHVRIKGSQKPAILRSVTALETLMMTNRSKVSSGSPDFSNAPV